MYLGEYRVVVQLYRNNLLDLRKDKLCSCLHLLQKALEAFSSSLAIMRGTL